MFMTENKLNPTKYKAKCLASSQILPVTPRSQKNTTDAGQKSQSIKTEPATRQKIESEDKNIKTVVAIDSICSGSWKND